MIHPSEFRRTLGRFATGVTVVTSRLENEIYGITVNAFASVSLEPPLVLVSIDRQAKAHQALAASGRYGVSILSREQRSQSDHFAGRLEPGLEPAFAYVRGLPLLEGALAHLVCRVQQQVEAGDHSLFIGEVEYLAQRPGAPLLYYAGNYAHLADSSV